MLTSSGLCDYLCQLLAPAFKLLGIPVEIFPLILLRPFSGSASIATYKEIMTKYGPDSFASICASIIMASSDTFVYVICMYFSLSKIKKTRYALPVCAFISLLCVFLSTVISRLFLNII
jgi:spore maturation protein B